MAVSLGGRCFYFKGGAYKLAKAFFTKEGGNMTGGMGGGSFTRGVI